MKQHNNDYDYNRTAIIVNETYATLATAIIYDANGKLINRPIIA